MPVFRFKAVKPGGEVFEGELEMADEQSLVRHLQAEGWMPVRVEPAGGAEARLRRLFSPRPRRRLNQKKILHFTQELATLLEAGLTLDRALQILGELSDDGELQGLMQRLRERVQSGTTFSQALAEEQGLFSPLYLNMVKAGEVGGVMQVTLARVAEYLERSNDLRESVRSALTYPMILLLVAGLSVILLLVFVVPQFSQMFADMGQALPLPTRIVIAAGDLFRDYWWLLLGILLLGIAWLRASLENEQARRRWDRRLLGWPLIGDLLAKVETARFARTLATLLEAGLPLLSALKLVQGGISNSVIASGLAEAAENLKRGRGLADPLLEQRVLPPLALQMIKVGEESGNLEPMLTKVADVFDQEVRESVKQMLTLLEPLLIVGLGLIVAGIIVSILLAVLSANELAF
ncbi:MAG TPA: type II secretion system F family protein [Sedimenticola sp.]|nr:type II secretion system F family protein [Sedimenticola sp.]